MRNQVYTLVAALFLYFPVGGVIALAADDSSSSGDNQLSDTCSGVSTTTKSSGTSGRAKREVGGGLAALLAFESARCDFMSRAITLSSEYRTQIQAWAVSHPHAPMVSNLGSRADSPVLYENIDGIYTTLTAIQNGQVLAGVDMQSLVTRSRAITQIFEAYVSDLNDNLFVATTDDLGYERPIPTRFLELRASRDTVVLRQAELTEIIQRQPGVIAPVGPQAAMLNILTRLLSQADSFELSLLRFRIAHATYITEMQRIHSRNLIAGGLRSLAQPVEALGDLVQDIEAFPDDDSNTVNRALTNTQALISAISNYISAANQIDRLNHVAGDVGLEQMREVPRRLHPLLDEILMTLRNQNAGAAADPEYQRLETVRDELVEYETLENVNQNPRNSSGSSRRLRGCIVSK